MKRECPSPSPQQPAILVLPSWSRAVLAPESPLQQEVRHMLQTNLGPMEHETGITWSIFGVGRAARAS
jgi:hypothetical protein